jgi:hypothetical protein
VAGDVEAVKKTLATWLASSRFSDALAAVNAEQNDGYTTPGLQAVYGYERAVIEAYPAVELQGLRTDYAQDDDLKNATHSIAIVFTQVGDNEAAVTTDVERLVRAARDMCWRSVLDAQEGLAPLVVVSEDYSALAPDPNGNPFMKGGRLIVAAQTLT